MTGSPSGSPSAQGIAEDPGQADGLTLVPGTKERYFDSPGRRRGFTGVDAVVDGQSSVPSIWCQVSGVRACDLPGGGHLSGSFELLGRLDIHALPSIDALFSGDWTHLTMKWTGQFVGSDGYETQDRQWGIWVLYVPEADLPHVVASEVENIIFNGADGGNYKVSYRFHVTLVDDELKTEFQRSDSRCIRQPG